MRDYTTYTYKDNRIKRFDETIDYLKRVICVLQDMKAGKSTASACRENNINITYLRHLINKDFASVKETPFVNLYDGQEVGRIMLQEELLSWQEQLYLDIFGERKICNFYEIPLDINESVEYVLSTFPDDKKRDAEILRKKYKDGLSLYDLGEYYNISPQRIRAITERAKRIMRSPGKARILKFGLKKCNLIKSLREENQKNDNYFLADDGIDRLPLSVRAYNCLTRSGIKTIGDLCSKTESDLRRIRNMGEKTFFEITTTLEKLGLSLNKERGIYE